MSWVASYPLPQHARPAPGGLGPVRHALHHAFGSYARHTERATTKLDLGELELGDVIVAAHGRSAYGYFAHVGAVTAPNETLGQHPAHGIELMPLDAFADYDDVRVLRAALTDAQRREVARFLRGLHGERFHVLALKHDPHWWHCSKAVWAAFARVGVDLAPERELVVPDDIAASPRLTTIRRGRRE